MTYQGPEVEELSTERRRLWVSAISRDDLTENFLNSDRVCNQHFHSGTAAPLWDRYNIDWVPTLNLGHGKSGRRREYKMQHEKLEQRGPRKGENDTRNCENKNV